MRTEFNEEAIRIIMNQAFPTMEKTWKRDVKIFTSISYDSDTYRVWFFDFMGSPSKAQGIIRREALGFMAKVLVGHKLKTFYFNSDLERVSWSKIQY